MAKPLKVWNGTEWVEIAAQLVDTDNFLLASTASNTYVSLSSQTSQDILNIAGAL